MRNLVTAISSFALFVLPVVAGATAAAVKVECNGNCGTVSPQNACAVVGSNYRPYGVAPADTTPPENWASEYVCGSSGLARCEDRGITTGNQRLTYWGWDEYGNDAVVMCTNGSGAPTIPTLGGSTMIKVECNGDCRNIALGGICRNGQVPFGIACDDISADSRSGWYSCGVNGARCTGFGRMNAFDLLGSYCRDGDYYDATVMCTSVTNPVARLAKVECQGNCDNVSVGQACAAAGGGTPLDISCTTPAYPGKGTAIPCGTGNARCINYGALVANDKIGAYCGDVNGIDAIVTCEGAP